MNPENCPSCGGWRGAHGVTCALAPSLASGALVTDSSPARLSVHVYQDRIEGEGFVVAGLTVEHYVGQPVTVLRWEGRDPDMDPDLPSFSLTFAQAEQLRDALTEVLAREPAKQDPVADAEEDELYRTAVAAVGRMEAAEAREDAADAAGRGSKK